VAIVWSNVTDVAPELASGVPAGLQTTLVALANSELDDDVLEGKADLCRAYWAAHFATIAKRGDVPGSAISESIGDVSVMYGNTTPMGSDPAYDATPYGKVFRLLVRQCPNVHAFVLNG
jgi:hypothetical protein